MSEAQNKTEFSYEAIDSSNIEVTIGGKVFTHSRLSDPFAAGVEIFTADRGAILSYLLPSNEAWDSVFDSSVTYLFNELGYMKYESAVSNDSEKPRNQNDVVTEFSFYDFGENGEKNIGGKVYHKRMNSGSALMGIVVF